MIHRVLAHLGKCLSVLVLLIGSGVGAPAAELKVIAPHAVKVLEVALLASR